MRLVLSIIIYVLTLVAGIVAMVYLYDNTHAYSVIVLSSLTSTMFMEFILRGYIEVRTMANTPLLENVNAGYSKYVLINTVVTCTSILLTIVNISTSGTASTIFAFISTIIMLSRGTFVLCYYVEGAKSTNVPMSEFPNV